MNLLLHSFLISVLDGDESSASRSGPLLPSTANCLTNWRIRFAAPSPPPEPLQAVRRREKSTFLFGHRIAIPLDFCQWLSQFIVKNWERVSFFRIWIISSGQIIHICKRKPTADSHTGCPQQFNLLVSQLFVLWICFFNDTIDSDLLFIFSTDTDDIILDSNYQHRKLTPNVVIHCFALHLTRISHYNIYAFLVSHRAVRHWPRTAAFSYPHTLTIPVPELCHQ
jgi:hypothetical protein